MVHHFQRYMSEGSPVPFLYPVIPRVIFPHPTSRDAFNPESWILKSRIPCFKYGKFRIPKTHWGPCIRHYEAWNSFKSSKLRSFPENFDKFASTIIFKWWSTAKTCESIWLLNEWVTDLNFPSVNVVQVRHCRDNKGVTICGTSATVLLYIYLIKE